MKRLILLSIIALTLGACHRRFYPSSVKDSVKIETRYEYIETLKDTTIYVEVPKEVEKIVTQDTISHLENSIAYSDATVSGGLLYHSLVNKNVSLPATIQVKEVEVIRDSIVFQDRVETFIHEVNYLTWWQKLWCTLGKWLTGIGLLFLAYKVTRHFLTLKKIKL